MNRDAAGTYETQFVSQSDDENTLYNVEKILDEKGGRYKVQWEGIDPATGDKWKPDWVRKTDCTDDLIADWKKVKEARGRRGKSSSSAAGSVGSRPIASSSKPAKSRLSKTVTPVSPPVSEARSNSTTRTNTKTKFIIKLPSAVRPKRPRESDTPLSPVKRLRLNGPASPLPASPFDDDDGGIVQKQRAGPVTYKKRKQPAIGKSPLARKPSGSVRDETSKISAYNVAGPSRVKPVILLSSISKATKPVEDSGTEDEDSDPQPQMTKRAPPLTRSRQASLALLKPPPFVRPHPDSSARTRPMPARDPKTDRVMKRDIQRSLKGELPASESARCKFPQIVSGFNPKKGNKSASTTKSNSSLRQAIQNETKPYSNHNESVPSKADTVDQDGEVGFGEGQGGEHVMSSIESENAPALSQAQPSPRTRNDTTSQPNGTQNDNSSKGTVVSDSQARTQDPGTSPPKPASSSKLASRKSNSPKRTSLAKRPTRKLRPSEMLRLGKAITVKPRPSDAETEPTMIESAVRQDSASEYEPQGSRSPSETSGTEAQATTPSKEESPEESEADSNVSDEDVEEGPSFRTRSQLSQGQPSSPARESAQEDVGLGIRGQVNRLLPRLARRDENEDEEGEHEPIITSSPSLGGTYSPVRRMQVEVVIPVPSSSSQKTNKVELSPEEPAEQEFAKQEPATQHEEPVTQETMLEPELEPGPVWPDQRPGEETLNETDQSLVHDMEVDRILAEDESHPTVEEPADQEFATAVEDVIDLTKSTQDGTQSVVNPSPDITAADPPVEPTQSIQNESQLANSSNSAPQPTPERPPPSIALLSVSNGSSQSQRLQESQPSTFQLQLRPQPQPRFSPQPETSSQSQPPPQYQRISQIQLLSQPHPEERTHSSIEETSSPFPPPGQVPRPPSTISSFTPSGRALHATDEHAPSSSNPLRFTFPPTANGSVPSHGYTQNSAELGPVPDLGTGVFHRHQSPGSDIDEFDDSKKALWTQVLRDKDKALEEAESKLAARDHRIVELLAQVEQLTTEKKLATGMLRHRTIEFETAAAADRASHATELAENTKTIGSLQHQVQALEAQFEIAESQRATAMEQYTIASDRAQLLADENKASGDRIQLLERQVKEGLNIWRRGFEMTTEAKDEEIRQLQVQLDLEREIRAKTDGREIRRRAAEWYELKKKVEDLEAENVQVEQEVNSLRTREKEWRLKEETLEERIEILKTRAPLSQPQTDRGLSQDDMQTETVLSNRSAVLADLDGPLGEEMVWMCTYRDTSDRLCGKAFDSMGLLLMHVLDGDHKLDVGCHCK